MKGKSEFSVFLMKMQPSARIFAAICAFAIASCLIWIGCGGYGDLDSKNNVAMINGNDGHIRGGRTMGLDVKVLATDASDESLNVLPKDSFSFAAVIDAGSSGSRVHIYRYGKLGSIDGPLYVLPNHQSFKEKPGLSSFAKNPDDAPNSMKALVKSHKMRQNFILD